MNCRRLAGSVHLLNLCCAPSQYCAMAVLIAPVLRRRAVLSASSSFRAFKRMNRRAIAIIRRSCCDLPTASQLDRVFRSDGCNASMRAISSPPGSCFDAEAGDATAAIALGATDDPSLLAKLGAVGISADLEKARFWYEKAASLGSSDAKRRLE